jgi:hypothetical protein
MREERSYISSFAAVNQGRIPPPFVVFGEELSRIASGRNLRYGLARWSLTPAGTDCQVVTNGIGVPVGSVFFDN